MFYASMVLGISIVISGVYIGIFSDMPKVQTVEVRGNRLVSKEEIIHEAKKEFASADWWRGVLGESHILFWRPGEMKKVINALPKLKTAETIRATWKREVTIEVEEKEAKGVWCAWEGRCFVFNEEGVLFAEAPEVRGYLITKIIGEEGAPISIGDQVVGNAEWFQNIRKIIEEVEGAGIRVKTARMTSRERKEWSIETADGKEFLFDFTRAPERVGAILGELSQAEGARTGRIFDFRVPEKVYVR